jgi:redox-sensitive bicupin YhaK (pirin superfamily)
MIELVIEQRRRNIGSFEVGRVLPFAKRRMVGPFVFFDHMGPVDLPRGLAREADILPHPHIGLSTVTYLFAGEIIHRDSTGVEQAIRPGQVNWMIAGSGITHSERFEQARREGAPLHARIALPPEHAERAAFVVSGAVEANGRLIASTQMAVFGGGAEAVVEAASPSVLMLLGGAPVGERFIEWNFVSSSRERIAQAKEDWRAGRMKLPDLDSAEFTPLPRDPLTSAPAMS